MADAPKHRRSVRDVPPDRVYRRVYEVVVIWTQPDEQEHIDDWGNTICQAIHEEGSALYDLREMALEELTPAAALGDEPRGRP